MSFTIFNSYAIVNSEKAKILKYDNHIFGNKKEGEMTKKKRVDWFMEFLRWGLLILAILFFIWLIKQLGWI